MIVIVICVDDLIIDANNDLLLRDIKNMPQERLRMKDRIDS